MNGLSRTSGLLVVAVVSASLVAVEVLLTRLLSVTAWYSHAFLVLSLAMLGLTRGSVVALEAQARGEPMGPWLSGRLVMFALGLLGATLVTVATPVTLGFDLTSFGTIVLVAASATVPMVAAGSIVARVMGESTASVPTLYAVDLVAAAGGALLPLVLLGPLSAPAALTLLALVASALALQFAPREGRWRAGGALAVSALLFVLGAFTHRGFELHYSKGLPRPTRDHIAFEAWNPLSQLTLTTPQTMVFPLWSPGRGYQPPFYAVENAYIDGEAGTPLYPFHTLEDLAPLRFDSTTSAHALRPTGTACVIGIGGGRDLAAALLFGHDPVLGAEINPAMVRMLEGQSAVSPIATDPRVRIEVGDGRAVLARHPNVHCQVLQASLVDTWAATGAGAFAHAEATLYTREAWSLFLRRVEPDGVLTMSRWYDPRNVSETSRLVSLAMASLLDRGETHPADHLVLFTAGRVATILVSPAPFSVDDMDRVRELETTRHFTVAIAPDRPTANPLLGRLLAARTIHDLDVAGDRDGLDTSPPTDDRPFFFQLLGGRAWLHPIETWRTANASLGVLSGNSIATLELLMTFLAVALVGLVLLGPTLARSFRSEKPPLPSRRAGVYFGALGAGFMLTEVALVQRMHVVLGHPTYALIVVLAGLLVATGIGSALSPWIVRSRRAVSVVATVAAIVLMALPFVVIHPLARATADASLAVRIAWTGGTAALVGVLLGVLFPSGIRFVPRGEGAPMALALNGVTSVLGSVAAIVVSVFAGIPASFVLAGGIYLVAAWAGPWSWDGSTRGG